MYKKIMLFISISCMTIQASDGTKDAFLMLLAHQQATPAQSSLVKLDSQIRAKIAEITDPINPNNLEDYMNNSTYEFYPTIGMAPLTVNSNSSQE